MIQKKGEKAIKYEKSLKEFLSEVKNSLNPFIDNSMILFFKNLKIGFIISGGLISYSNFGNNKDFIDDIFKSEGLFIRT